MNTRARPTAFHEAGHTLAFWWNERPIERVTVRTPVEAANGPMLDLRGNLQQVEGLVEASYFVLRPSGEAPGVAEYLPSMVEWIERDLLNCFAGPIAEAIYRHAPPEQLFRGSGRGDWLRGEELISLLPARKLLDAHSRAIARSHCLLQRYWPAVTALAQRLQTQGTVDGPTITALLWDLSGESPGRRDHTLASLDRPGN
ncbi:hypothetical protein [Pseudomonas sp. RA_35y_Pfl2_P32]|uniref:hypothetical protein n=1 Tax=Pseudomonas sp. RA_35y_Pfl2_P32 TaxID=3088705 RepID=UPI0030DB76EF